MTCHTHIDVGAADRQQCSAVDRALDNEDRLSGPAANTAKPRTSGTLNAMVASRCNRLEHSNNEQRKRYLDIHRTLAAAICSGVHDGR